MNKVIKTGFGALLCASVAIPVAAQEAESSSRTRSTSNSEVSAPSRMQPATPTTEGEDAHGIPAVEGSATKPKTSPRTQSTPKNSGSAIPRMQPSTTSTQDKGAQGIPALEGGPRKPVVVKPKPGTVSSSPVPAVATPRFDAKKHGLKPSKSKNPILAQRFMDEAMKDDRFVALFDKALAAKHDPASLEKLRAPFQSISVEIAKRLNIDLSQLQPPTKGPPAAPEQATKDPAPSKGDSIKISKLHKFVWRKGCDTNDVDDGVVETKMPALIQIEYNEGPENADCDSASVHLTAEVKVPKDKYKAILSASGVSTVTKADANTALPADYAYAEAETGLLIDFGALTKGCALSHSWKDEIYTVGDWVGDFHDSIWHSAEGVDATCMVTVIPGSTIKVGLYGQISTDSDFLGVAFAQASIKIAGLSVRFE